MEVNVRAVLVTTRQCHITGTKWGMRRYTNMDRLVNQQKEASAMAG